MDNFHEILQEMTDLHDKVHKLEQMLRTYQVMLRARAGYPIAILHETEAPSGVFYAKYQDRVLQPYMESEQFGPSLDGPTPNLDQAPVCGDCEQGPGQCQC